MVAIDKPNAGINGTTLFITTGFEPYIGTNFGEAILAHELAHAKLRHFIKHALVVVGIATVSLVFTGQISALDDVTGLVVCVSAFTTLLAFVSPLVLRKMEYEADALAVKVVEPSAMIGALKAMVPAEEWDHESDSHPSVKARIQRLQMK